MAGYPVRGEHVEVYADGTLWQAAVPSEGCLHAEGGTDGDQKAQG